MDYLRSPIMKKKMFLVLTSGKFLEALGSGIGTGSIFCLSFSLSTGWFFNYITLPQFQRMLFLCTRAFTTYFTNVVTFFKTNLEFLLMCCHPKKERALKSYDDIFVAKITIWCVAGYAGHLGTFRTLLPMRSGTPVFTLLSTKEFCWPYL